MSPNLTTTLWTRNGLDDKDRHQCICIVKGHYPDQQVEELRDQGYCSYTLLISPISVASREQSRARSTTAEHTQNLQQLHIVQLRPEQHSLDLNIARIARRTYGLLAPEIRGLNIPLPPRLRAFELSYLNGNPYSRHQCHSLQIDPSLWNKQITLVQSFARVIARSWNFPPQTADCPQSSRSDSPVGDNPDSILPQCSGRVGSKIAKKLQQLSQNLPDVLLRQKAEDVLSRVTDLKGFPVVLNHGDLIPSNILIDKETWKIRGLVDWAEAEILPFGTCLYGLEFLLGYLDTSEGTRPKFVYYDGAPRLRELFWSHLEENIPDMRQFKEHTLLARDMGVLLWFGYAWDEGAIDRVVNNEDDKEELECLRTFLNIGIY